MTDEHEDPDFHVCQACGHDELDHELGDISGTGAECCGCKRFVPCESRRPRERYSIGYMQGRKGL